MTASMRVYSLNYELWLPRTPEEIFPLFSDARNLEQITPPWLCFRVLSVSPEPLQAGSRIDYRLKLHGIPIRWQSEITAWEPPVRFTDEQRQGPYRLWIHEHTFEARDGGTLARDFVSYAVWGGFLVDQLLVAPDVRRIFQYRRQELTRRFSN